MALKLKSETDVPVRCFSKVFPLCSSSAHRTQGVNLGAALKASEGHCRREQRLLKPAVPTQGIVNIGSQPLRPTTQNFPVLRAHGSALSRTDAEARALLGAPSPVRQPEESCPALQKVKVKPVTWRFQCNRLPAGSGTFSRPKNV